MNRLTKLLVPMPGAMRHVYWCFCGWLRNSNMSCGMNLYILTLSAVLVTACASPHVPSRDDCTSLNECSASVKTSVERAWKKPEGAPFRGLSAELRVTLGEQFEVQSVVVKRSSGNPEFDNSAVEAVRAAAQFPELKGLDRNDARHFRDLEFRFMPKLE